MTFLTPASVEDLACLLKEHAGNSRSIAIAGNSSKRLMAGPLGEPDFVLTTAGLDRVLAYESADLTISVEAGARWADVQSILAQQNQMIALDPPFWPQATVGGVIASNGSGPLRCAFGTARDVVIGMQFATLGGKLIRVGGMVVKNVAGLDMGKLLIGSFGTLAVLTSVNLRLHARPAETETFVFSFLDIESAVARRNTLRAGPLRPLAVDILSAAASARVGLRGFSLAIRAAGSPRVLARYADELVGSTRLTGKEDASLWEEIREFPATFLARQPHGVILCISTPISDLTALLREIPGAFISRAYSGVSYAFLSSFERVPAIWNLAADHGWQLVLEFAPEQIRASCKLWLPPASNNDNTFAMMKSVKQMFDPRLLLNHARLYGRL
ncbi:MAG TPA: FAD-binding oxidoreductase [Bryobacteraceae bacterium]|nr:FAD-binding oxidoreductase [Bryobacteraceae bacterium]